MTLDTSANKRSRRSAEEAAKAAILENPDFVLTDPDIMRALLAPMDPAATSGRQVVDLRAAVIDRLERRLARLQEAHRDIIDAAWDSLISIEHVHQATLNAMDAGSVGGLASAVRETLPGILEIDRARLCFERDAAPMSLGEDGSATLLDTGFIAARLQGPGLIDGRLLITSVDGGAKNRAPGVDSAVFDLEAEQVRSAAYLLLGGDGPKARALLALGSADGERFSAGRNADLLKFLGSVMDRRLRDLAFAELRSATASASR